MKNTKWLFAILSILVFCSFTLAQATPAEPLTVAKVLDRDITNAEHHIVSAAEAMPEDTFNFAPTTGEFKGIRTFAQQIKHAAMSNYMIAATILGEKPPVDVGGDNGPDALKTKAEIVKFLKGSFEYSHKAVLGLTDKNQLEPMPNPFGPQYGKVTRLEIALWISTHSFNHYGQMVEYLRMNGIVPPASRQ